MHNIDFDPSALKVAGLVGTISYEILTGMTGRVPRVWSEPAVLFRSGSGVSSSGDGSGSKSKL